MNTMSKAPEPYAFDDRNIQWQPLGELQHFVAKIYRVDEANRRVDFIVKFDPLETIVPHRHIAPTNTFVVQGEHRLYELDGRPKEIRPSGTFTATPAGTPGHLECGGDEGAIVLYHMWTEDGSDDLFETRTTTARRSARWGSRISSRPRRQRKRPDPPVARTASGLHGLRQCGVAPRDAAISSASSSACS